MIARGKLFKFIGSFPRCSNRQMLFATTSESNNAIENNISAESVNDLQKVETEATETGTTLKPPRRAMALPAVSPITGMEKVVASAKAKFDETVELSLGLGIDPRKPNQTFRTLAQLPHGSGKTATVAVFAQGDAAEKAKAAGAAIVGAEELVADIQAGKINFNRCIATPDMMPLVGRIARVLGPRGLMPNPKMGTVTLDVETAVSNALKGEIELRADKFGFVNVPLGKVSFPRDKLLDNLKAVMVTVTNEKPTGASGKYLKQAVLSSTMGKGVQLDVELLDPSSQKFMQSNN